MGVKVVYRDVDFETKKNLSKVSYTASVQGSYMDSSLLKLPAVPPVRQATLEKDFWRLDGSYDLPDTENNMNIGYFGYGISSEIESGNGYALSQNADVSFFFNKTVSIDKITFSFDDPDYCTHLLVQGYSNAEQTNKILESTVYPDNSFYTYKIGSSKNVASLKFTFYAMNKPNRFLKLYGIDFGEAYSFEDYEVYNVSILKETSLLNQQIPIGTSSISLDTRNKNIEVFKKYKPVFIFKDGKIEQTHYVSMVDTGTTNRADLECSDVMFLLNDFAYTEGITEKQTYTHTGSRMASKFSEYTNNMPGYEGPYNLNATLSDVVGKAVSGMPLKVIVERNYASAIVDGYYEDKNQKDLLNQLSFVNQAPVHITNNGIVIVGREFGDVKKIPQNRVFNNVLKRTEEKVNAVSINVYKYNKEDVLFEDYTDTFSPIERTFESENPIFFKYTQINDTSGTSVHQVDIISDYSFYVHPFKVANANANYKMYVSYFVVVPSQIKSTYYLEDINANNTVNLAEISNIAFLTDSKLDTVLNALIEYYKHNSSLEFDMIIKDEQPGDWLEVHTIDRIYTGRIEKMEYTMQGKRIGTVTMRIYEEVSNG